MSQEIKWVHPHQSQRSWSVLVSARLTVFRGRRADLRIGFIALSKLSRRMGHHGAVRARQAMARRSRIALWDVCRSEGDFGTGMSAPSMHLGKFPVYRGVLRIRRVLSVCMRATLGHIPVTPYLGPNFLVSRSGTSAHKRQTVNVDIRTRYRTRWELARARL